jgi:hypothetical protein
MILQFLPPFGVLVRFLDNDISQVACVLKDKAAPYPKHHVVKLHTEHGGKTPHILALGIRYREKVKDLIGLLSFLYQ